MILEVSPFDLAILKRQIVTAYVLILKALRVLLRKSSHHRVILHLGILASLIFASLLAGLSNSLFILLKLDLIEHRRVDLLVDV